LLRTAVVSLTAVGHWLKSRQVVLLLLLILALGSFLRIYDLGAESIWLDEAWSIQESAMSIQGIAQNSNQPPLYFLILNFWINLFGTSEVALRSLSAIFGIISILFIYQVGSTLFNRRVGLISGLLSAISYYHIYYSQEARGYSLLLLLSLLSYLFFIEILQEDGKWHYPGYFLANLLLGYTHIYGLFIIASQILYFLLFWNKYRAQRVKFITTVAVTIVTLLPLVPLMWGRVVSIAQRGFWIPAPNFGTIWDTLATFAGSGGGREVILLTFVLLAIIGFFSIKMVESKWRWKEPLQSLSSLGRSIKLESIEQELLLIIWLSFPIIIPFIISQFMTPIYLTRYMIGASPAFYLLVAKGMGNLNRKWLFYPVLIFIILLSSFGLQSYYKNDVKEQWREVANLVELNSMRNDVIIVCAFYYRLPFDYYYQGDLAEFGIARDLEDTEELTTFVNYAVRGKDRLWLILCYSAQSAPIRSYLTNRYGSRSILMEEHFVGILVLLFDLSPP
jgi:mannosyltransferase